jgi:hypothetical protein
MSGDYKTSPDFSTKTACCDDKNIYFDSDGVANGVIYFMYPIITQNMDNESLLGEPFNLFDLLT